MDFTSDECLTALQFGQISSLRDLTENLGSKQSCVQMLEGFIIEVLEPCGFGVLGKNKVAWYIVL
jgi:hypothetical protein